MAEYIELDAAVALLEEKLRDICPLGRCSRNAVYGADRDLYDTIQSDIEALYSHPAADVVEVVRCKDCKFAEIFDHESYCLCLRKMAGKIRPDDFCSYGERKDGE